MVRERMDESKAHSVFVCGSYKFVQLLSVSYFV